VVPHDNHPHLQECEASLRIATTRMPRAPRPFCLSQFALV
jgi:hypothetical protein